MFFSLGLSSLLLITWAPYAFTESDDTESPNKITFHNVTRCDIDAEEDQLQLTYDQNEDQTWTTDWTWPFDVDDSIKLIETNWYYGLIGWEEVDSSLDTEDFCTIIEEDHRKFFEPLLENMGAPDRCPIPAGTYEVRNFGIDPSTLTSFATNEVGDYHADLEFFKEDTSSGSSERFGCIRIYYTVDP